MNRIAQITGYVALMALAACGQNRTNFHQFDGQTFSGRAKGEERGSASFAATVNGVSKSLDGARQAVAYEAVQYCINTYGTSDIVWQNAPDADRDALLIDGDSLTVNGICVE